jgi:hypothetical protein
MTDSPVTLAMADERPEKDTMRELWADCLEPLADGEFERDGSEPPLYLGLCGARGLDILKFVERGIVARTETGAIAEADLGKIVAIEADTEAAEKLRDEFFGLDVFDTKLEQLLQMPSDVAWPGKKLRRILRARIVNLDVNQALEARVKQSQLQFPLVKMIEKFAVLHAQDPHVNWSLCLTLHADLALDPGALGRIASFLAENFEKEETFGVASSGLLGDDLYQQLAQGKCPDDFFDDLQPDDIQSLLMALIPKRIISDTHRHGWKVTTRRNLRYGGEPVAPMVSWILDFEWDPRGTSAPQQLYSESLGGAVATVEQIGVTGDVVALAA